MIQTTSKCATATYRIDIIDPATKIWAPLPDGAGVAGGFVEGDAIDYVEIERGHRRLRDAATSARPQPLPRQE